MATWVLTGTGLPVSSSPNGDLTADIPLTGAQPADFDPAGVTQIAVSRTIRAAGLVDDSWTDTQSFQLLNDAGQAWFSTLPGTVSGLGNGDRTINPSVSGAPANAPSATGNYADGGIAAGGTWATYESNMKADGGTLELLSITVTITYTPPTSPIASFTASPTTIYTGQQVQFTDTSTNGPTAWSWNFDGGAAGSTQRNPLVTFNTPGVYNVVLTASNLGGSDPSNPTAITVLAREAEVWNGSAWVGGESWNGVAWVTPEVYDGTQWIPVKAP